MTPIPISEMSEAQKNAYWAAQGVQLAPSATGATKIGVGANGVIIYDPASVAAGQAAAIALAQTDPVVVAALAALKPVARTPTLTKCDDVDD